MVSSGATTVLPCDRAMISALLNNFGGRSIMCARGAAVPANRVVAARNRRE